MKKMSRHEMVVRVQSGQGTKRISTKKTERFKKFLEKVCNLPTYARCACIQLSFSATYGRLRRLSS